MNWKMTSEKTVSVNGLFGVDMARSRQIFEAVVHGENRRRIEDFRDAYLACTTEDERALAAYYFGRMIGECSVMHDIQERIARAKLD